MTIEELKELAARYNFVIAESEEEKEELESLGYHQVDFDLPEVMPELYISYSQEVDCYGVMAKGNSYRTQKSFRFAA
ncbi:MAG: hypothetical protein HFE46_07255 [Clostridia bacterium]|nr:hypothetical protein [Clostridia bacterium]